jgi:hypothetical protein
MIESIGFWAARAIGEFLGALALFVLLGVVLIGITWWNQR